jgi:deoxynucleoside triphosphate triphosphohydrolase SAMHD1
MIHVISIINDDSSYMLKLECDHIQIYDNIHKYIKVSNYAKIIMHTPFFQRLRDLHQLGTCHYIWPTAKHSRFEHSLGTYYLAGRILDCIKRKTPQHHLNEWLATIPELSCHLQKKQFDEAYLDDYIIELIKIAALCHDIGHGPFSHVFDDIIVPELDQDKIHANRHHEERSGSILKYIIKNTALESIIYDGHIQFMIDLINPQRKHKCFIYQIVSNNLNGLDVDKYDYIVRDSNNIGLEFSIDYSRLIDDVCVIDDIICYPKQVYIDILNIFTTRYRLHKQIYTHKTVISIQHQLCEIIVGMNKWLKIEDRLNDISKFCELTDTYVTALPEILGEMYTMMSKNDTAIDSPLYDMMPNIQRSIDLYHDILIRKIYKHIRTFVSSVPASVSDELKTTDGVYIFTTKIGFVSGNKKNPMNDIYFYDKKDLPHERKHFKISSNEMTIFFPDEYQEHIIMIFVKDREDHDLIDKVKQLCNDMDKIL